MIDFDKGTELLDHPEVLFRLFFPRREYAGDLDASKALNHFIQVAEGINLGCRFYPASRSAPNVLYFHGNGETAPDYDFIAPMYSGRGMNLFVADYRGYGMSNGSPTCSTIIKDAHPIFRGFKAFLREKGYGGGLFVMGRSLGSAPAIEVAYHYQDQLRGLIIESGFASASQQFERLGVAHLFEKAACQIGFANDLKVKEIVIPTLIIHGEDDAIIPLSEGVALFNLSGACKKSSCFIPGAGHNDLLLRSLECYMETVERFLSGACDATIQ